MIGVDYARKTSALFAFALVFLAMLIMGSTEAEAKTSTLHTFFKQEGDGLKYGFKDDKGKVVVKAKYWEAGHFSEGLCPVSYDGKQWFYINTKGKKVFDIDSTGENYWTAGNYIDGVAIIAVNDTTSNDDTHSILNKKGKVLIASCLGSPERVTNYGFLFTSDGGEKSVYNMKGKQILSTTVGEYTLVDNPVECYNIPENKLHVARNKSGKYGFVDCKGKFVIKPVYRWAGEFRDGVALVEKGMASSHQNCLINKKGKTIVKFSKQVGVIRFASKYLYLEKTNPSNPNKPLTALVNLKGKYVMKFGKASDFGYMGYIGLNGRNKEYIPFEQKEKSPVQ